MGGKTGEEGGPWRLERSSVLQMGAFRERVANGEAKQGSKSQVPEGLKRVRMGLLPSPGRWASSQAASAASLIAPELLQCSDYSGGLALGKSGSKIV